jgi:hypothetical protein
MIKVNDGSVHFSGDIPRIFIDLVLLLHSFLDLVEEEPGMKRKDAEKLLVLAGKFAVLDADGLESKFEEIVEEFKSDSRL